MATDKAKEKYLNYRNAVVEIVGNTNKALKYWEWAMIVLMMRPVRRCMSCSSGTAQR